MPSRDTVHVLQAIAYNAALARRFVEGLSFEEFAVDERTLYAVTRCLEIISEASRRLPDDLKARNPQIPWERMAGAGNIFRHDYEDVLAEILWNTVKDHLGPIEKVVRAESP